MLLEPPLKPDWAFSKIPEPRVKIPGSPALFKTTILSGDWVELIRMPPGFNAHFEVELGLVFDANKIAREAEGKSVLDTLNDAATCVLRTITLFEKFVSAVGRAR